MKGSLCLKMTVAAIFLSLSFLAIFFTDWGKDAQDPWMSDLHPPRLALLTPSFFTLFPFPLPSPLPVEYQTKLPEVPPLHLPLTLSNVKLTEIPGGGAPQEETTCPVPSYGVSRTMNDPTVNLNQLAYGLTDAGREAGMIPKVGEGVGEPTPKGSDEIQEDLYFEKPEGIRFGDRAPKLERFLGILGKKKIQRQVEKAAMEIGVDPRLAKAMAAVESGYDQRAVSPLGAIGVLQLMPRFFCTDSEITPEMLFDPVVNIRVGLTHFKSLLDKFNENVDLSLAAYNAGAKRVIEAGHMIPPIEQTRDYVRKVKKAMDREDSDWSSLDQS